MMGFLANIQARNGQAQAKRFMEDKTVYERGLADSANTIAAELAARLPQPSAPVDSTNVGNGFGQAQVPVGLAQTSFGGM